MKFLSDDLEELTVHSIILALIRLAGWMVIWLFFTTLFSIFFLGYSRSLWHYIVIYVIVAVFTTYILNMEDDPRETNF